ncbi:MAG: ribosome-associated translation inhibitor RaiA [Ignavibacteriaceae bacterium]|nr:ribosome-associated translation inhibitor RaiA [Ignavibacteriaceae bacterium]
MNVSITARKFKAHYSLKQFVKDELSVLNRYNDDILSADVKLSFQNPTNSIKIADITVSIPGQILNATDHSEDFKKSITASVEKLTKQLKTIKSKRTTARVK